MERGPVKWTSEAGAYREGEKSEADVQLGFKTWQREKLGKMLLLNNAGLNQWVGLCLCQTGARGVHIRYRTKDISGEK